MKSEKVAKIVRQVLAEKPVPKYMNKKQAGNYCGISGSMIQQMKDQGKLDFFQPIVNGTVRFTSAHLDKFMTSREKTLRR